MTGVALSVSIFGLVGWAASRAFGITPALLSGMGIVGLVLFACGVAGLPLVPCLVVLVAVSVAAVAAVPRKEEGGPSYPVLPTAVGVVAIVWLSALAVVLPLEDYDGRAFWLLKAKAIAHEQAVDGPFFQGETSTSPRNRYPLLVPLDAATIMLAAGELDDRHVRLVYVLFAVGFALAIRDGLGRLTTPLVGAWSAALFLWLPQIGPEPDGGVLTGSADIALGAFVASAFFELLESRSAWRFGLWLPMIALTKSEGLPLAVLLFALGCLTFRAKVWRSAVPLAFGAFLLRWWGTGIERSDETDYGTLIWTLPERLPLFGRVLGDFVSQIWAFHDWGGLWIAALAGALWLGMKGRRRPLLLAGGVVVPMVVLYAAVIAVADWDLWAMTDSVVPRLMTHLVGPGVALLGLALATGQDDEVPRSQQRSCAAELAAADRADVRAWDE